jgi:hypothetical protein
LPATALAGVVALVGHRLWQEREQKRLVAEDEAKKIKQAVDEEKAEKVERYLPPRSEPGGAR